MDRVELAIIIVLFSRDGIVTNATAKARLASVPGHDYKSASMWSHAFEDDLVHAFERQILPTSCASLL